MTEPILPPLKPIPIKDRLSVLFIEKGNLDVLDGAFVIVDKTGVRTHVPVGGVACLMLEPGTRVSHNAVVLASRVGCLLVWIGEAGVRLYASGQPGGARADRLLYQAKLALDDTARLKVVRKMYTLRFGEALRSGAASSNCGASRGCGCARCMNSSAANSVWNGNTATTTTANGGAATCRTAACRLQHPASLRHLRGSHSGGRLCACCRLHTYGQATVFRL